MLPELLTVYEDVRFLERLITTCTKLSLWRRECVSASPVCVCVCVFISWQCLLKAFLLRETTCKQTLMQLYFQLA